MQVAISPYTAKGTVINNPTPVSPGVGMYYEHSSIPKSLHALFAPQVTHGAWSCAFAQGAQRGWGSVGFVGLSLLKLAPFPKACPCPCPCALQPPTRLPFPCYPMHARPFSSCLRLPTPRASHT